MGVIGISSKVGCFGFLSPLCENTDYICLHISGKLADVLKDCNYYRANDNYYCKPWGKVLYSLSMLFKVYMNLTIGTSVINGNF